MRGRAAHSSPVVCGVSRNASRILRLEFRFEPADVGGTLLTVGEYGWQEDRRRVLQSYGHCSGWQEMLTNLKALMEHGIDLEVSMTVRPNYQKLWASA